jgi:hypothetical protein
MDNGAIETKSMLGWFKKKPGPELASGKQVLQPPGEVFAWPKGWQLTALDEAILAVPAAVIGDREIIGSVIHCHDDVRINLPTGTHSTEGARIMLWLKPGQSVWLSKSCDAVVVANGEGDTVGRRFRVTEVTPHAER